MNLLVDPILYAVPAVNGNHEVHIQFIDSLIHWSEEIVAKRHNFYVWHECMYALRQAGCYPDHQNIKQLLKQTNEEIISPDFVFSLCKRLLERPYLDEWLQNPSLDDLLVSEADFKVNPDLLNRLPTVVAEAFQQTLGKIAYIKETQDEPSMSDLLLVTHPITGESVAEISALVDTDDEIDVVVGTDVPLITNSHELDAMQNLAEIWQDAENAIYWFAREMKRQGYLSDALELAPFIINHTFVSTIQKYHFDNNLGRLNQIFRKCVLLLAGLIPPDPSKHHTLNKHQQKTYGEWGAWRLHITGSPMAIRLHYWRHENRYILMHVIPHENFDIDSPPTDAFC